MSRPARARGPALALLACALLSGCGGGRLNDLELRLVEIELRLERLEARADGNAGLLRRMDTLEDAQTRLPTVVTPPAPRSSPADAVMLAELIKRLERLEARTPASSPLASDRRRTTIIPPKDPAKDRTPPPASAKLEVLAISSGDLILVRIDGKLEKVRLLGVDAPLRPDAYATNPTLHLQHEAGFGRRLVGNGPADRSRDRLEKLVETGALSLRYPKGQLRSTDGALGAQLLCDGKDVGAQLVGEGFALASDETYRALESAARAKKLGLFAK